MSDDVVTPESTPEASATEAPAPEPTETVDDGKYKSIARKQEQKYIEAAKERDELKTKLEEIEKSKLSDLERAQKDAEEARKQLDALKSEAETARLDALRTRIGAEKGLPPQLIERLRGEDEDGIRADADALLTAVKKDEAAWPDMGQGDKGKKTDADGFVDALNRTLGITT
jgi:hypothetical protein